MKTNTLLTKTIALLVLICSNAAFAQSNAPAPDFVWIRQAGGDLAGSDEGHGVAVDVWGNVYVTGGFSGNGNFGGVTLTNRGGLDIFVAKYDAAGALLWVRQAGGTGNSEYGQAIAVDTAGNCYVAGYFAGTATFDGTNLTSGGGVVGFVAKYGSDGDLLWARQAGCSSSHDDDDYAEGIGVDLLGNVYVIGTFKGDACFGEITLYRQGQKDVFVAKYDSRGNLQWVKQGKGGASDQGCEGYGIAVDGAGNSYVTGRFSHTIAFDTNTLNGGGMFIAEYDSAGNVLWAKKAGQGFPQIYGMSIAVDSGSNSVVTGMFEGNADFTITNLASAGSMDVFVAKYDNRGLIQWAKPIGGAFYDMGRSVAVSDSGEICLTGFFEDNLTIGGTNIPSSGSRDIFIAKFSSAGDLLWFKHAGGAGEDIGFGLALDSWRNVYLTGYFEGNVVFGGTNLTSGGNRDIFVAMLSGLTIITQPQNQTVNVGSNAVLTVEATGSGPLSYQWRLNGTNLVDGGNVSGATCTNLTLTNVQAGNSGLYAVVVSDTNGSILSLGANLIVHDPVLDDDDWDGLPRLLELQFGTDPSKKDTDDDGLNDYEEIFLYGTDPRLKDSDGDGIDDGTEVLMGRAPNFIGMRYSYDRNDRLVGVEYEKGLSIGYKYDGNGNLVRQSYLQRDQNTNGLPDLWEFLNGLTNNTSAFADTDGDGWSAYQEWRAGTSPTNAASWPDTLGVAGTNLASLALPFTPSNFVIGVGQLDGIGAEEIVIGADGNPGTNINFLLVLSQTTAGWTTQRADVGPFGVTSLAIGQVTNRPGAAIYAGLRQAGGTGRIVELMNLGGVWQTNIVAMSTNEAAIVLGVRPGNALLASLSPTNGPAWSLYGFAFTNNDWLARRLDSSVSRVGTLGTISSFTLSNTWGSALRLLDATNAIQIGQVGPNLLTNAMNLPTNAIYRTESASWYFLTPTVMSWSNAQAYAQTFGGNLATIEDAVENDWVVSTFARNLWIGLYGSGIDLGSWRWVSGSSATYRNWGSGEPDWGVQTILSPDHAGGWSANDSWHDDYPGLVETQINPGLTFLLTEPPATNRILWRGISLDSGLLRQNSFNAFSVFYAFVDDMNASGGIDTDDDFVLSEFVVNGTNAQIATMFRQPIGASTVAQSYGLASLNVLNTTNEVFFTGEPDGQVFAWTATNTMGPLQRQLFSAQHAGKAWHALAGVKTLEPGEGLVGLRVDPASPNTCDVIFWPPQPELWMPASVAQTAPLARILPDPNTGGGLARVRLRLWDGEGNASLPLLQYQLAGASNWLDAMIATVDGAAWSYSTRIAAHPAGSDHELVWNAAADLGIGVSTNLFLRIRAKDITLLGDWSAPMPYAVQATQDSDNDGLLDEWELEHFGNLDQGANDDPDGDAFTNLQEYLAGTNPMDEDSFLQLRISRAGAAVYIEWSGGTNAMRVLQRAATLGAEESWENIYTNPPGLPNGSVLDTIGTNSFYRLRVFR